MKKLFTRLKTKWDIKSNWDFFLIMLVFSLAGLNVSFGRKPIFHILGLTETTPMWIKVTLYLLLIFPLYQISLVFYGFILGQFNFFWTKQIKLGRFFKRKLTGIRIASNK